mmetsp:Transcript_15312/g.33082  ORF Transcript_15312/g.33082 Transcript_15312/m.33082 type:complete len:801 (-) Transcript_15312:195-2597(-)|eukprot:CAMPEP_0206545454 /NCGR_PEP_ID=MMETSP0325_2-20121206/12147_1 /ASSEMBLY_ACC=CAM_ASM_000347 /TAXON_ID=2866 /ORGANISM="Crypthecodinium cohnii, Strain Seligo" /LENGTH=800 /DNA_ID=CAMNT_0054044445 /DNA_START=17 /DNA_END=2419 /DNA_ORIENTATION=-
MTSTTSLSTRIAGVMRSAKPFQQHRQLLETFVEHGEKASAQDALHVMINLRQARENYMQERRKTNPGLGPQALRNQWSSEVTASEGWAQVTKTAFAPEKKRQLHEVDGTTISKAYNALSNLSKEVELSEELDDLWKAIHSKIVNKELTRQALMGIWAVAPAEKLPGLDRILAGRLRENKQDRLYLPSMFSLISRANAMPNSAAILEVAGILESRVEDLNAEDLAAIVAHLDLRVTSDKKEEVPAKIVDLVEKAKALIIEKDMPLSGQDLFRLFGMVDSRESPFFAYISKQLLAQQDLQAQQCLEIMKLLDRLPGEGSSQDYKLFKKAATSLQFRLRDARPELLYLVARHLPIFAHDLGTCQALLNVANRQRKDLFPQALWSIFKHASLVDLVEKHPPLHDRLKVLGRCLEENKSAVSRLTLTEMKDMAIAMRRNNVPLPVCGENMCGRFLEIYNGIKEGTEEEAWQKEAQTLLLQFWANLEAQGLATEPLAKLVESSLATIAEKVQIEVIAESIGDLAAAKESSNTETVQKIQKELAGILEKKLPDLSQELLLKAAKDAGQDSIRAAVTQEVKRRMTRISVLRNPRDYDALTDLVENIQMWERSAEEGETKEVYKQALPKLEGVLLSSLDRVKSEDAQASAERLRKVLGRLLVSKSPLEEEGLVALKGALVRLAKHCQTAKERPLASELATDLAFAYALVYRGQPPLDVLVCLYSLLGAAEAEAAGRVSEMGVVRRMLQNLHSKTAKAALAMLPGAPSVEAALRRGVFPKDRAQNVHFELTKGEDGSKLLKQFGLLPTKA